LRRRLRLLYQAGRALYSQKSNNNGEALPEFLKSGWGQLLWKSKWEEDPFGVAVLVTRSW
jgi:hypothetical protein